MLKHPRLNTFSNNTDRHRINSLNVYKIDCSLDGNFLRCSFNFKNCSVHLLPWSTNCQIINSSLPLGGFADCRSSAEGELRAELKLQDGKTGAVPPLRLVSSTSVIQHRIHQSDVSKILALDHHLLKGPGCDPEREMTRSVV